MHSLFSPIHFFEVTEIEQLTIKKTANPLYCACMNGYMYKTMTIKSIQIFLEIGQWKIINRQIYSQLYNYIQKDKIIVKYQIDRELNDYIDSQLDIQKDSSIDIQIDRKIV